MATLPIIVAVAVGIILFKAPIYDKVYMVTVGACVVLAVFLAVIALVISIRVSKGISNLYEGIRAVSAGNFGIEAAVNGNDEIAELAEAFNKMRKQLETWRTELERECEEHKKTAASLRESNRRLSDVLIKLKRAQEQSIEQERMQALKQIASGIVHDFNSSLTPILGTTEYLLSTPEALGNREDIMDSLRLIDEASKAAGSVVRNLSEFFRPTTTEMNDLLSVNDVVQNVISLTKPKWKEQSEVEGATITIITELQKNAPTIHGNRIELEEALTNLILNAVDAMPAGGTLTFKTRPEGDMSVIEISDSGEGMTPEIRSRCFEPFFSTKGPASSGMGLAITKGILARHKGTLSLDSETGKGTTVVIRLPIGISQQPHKAHDTGAATPIAGLHILVVDDESWSRRIIQKYLEADRCTVETAVDGHDALVKLTTAKFNVVILDRAMPDMSGDQLALHIMKANPGMPIVMLTGFGEIMEERGEHPKGVDIIISKPFTKNEIRTGIASAIRTHSPRE